MREIGYTIDELDFICKNQQTAISIGINHLARIRELLNKDKIKVSDVQLCLVLASDGILKVEDVLMNNPVPASTKDWIKTKRQGRRKK